MANPLYDLQMQVSSEVNKAKQRYESSVDSRNYVRFSWNEIAITLIVLAVLIAFITPMVSSFVQNAKDSARAQNENALFMSINNAILLNQPSEAEIAEFRDKYSAIQPITQLIEGELTLEKTIAPQLLPVVNTFRDSEGVQQTVETIGISKAKGYISLEFEGLNLKKVNYFEEY